MHLQHLSVCAAVVEQEAGLCAARDTIPAVNGSFSAQFPLILTLGFGFILGMKHALDADHLVAMSTILSRQASLWRSSIVGAYWGLGHTASLLVASLVVVGFRQSISEQTAVGLELVVALMLVLLGLDLLRRIRRGDLTIHSHEHDGHVHLHAHLGRHRESVGHHHVRIGSRSFFIGIVHGLAGSAALTLFMLSTLRSLWTALAYVVVFGAGTMVGMLLMSLLIGLPVSLAVRRGAHVAVPVQVLAGIGSVAFGLWYTYRVASANGMF